MFVSASLCTPPIPPVANTAIFAKLEIIIVDATVVEPDNFCETAIEMSRLEILSNLLHWLAKNSISSFNKSYF